MDVDVCKESDTYSERKRGRDGEREYERDRVGDRDRNRHRDAEMHKERERQEKLSPSSEVITLLRLADYFFLAQSLFIAVI